MKFHGNPGEKDGLLQEFVVLPEECCFKIMKTLSLQSAALLEPLAVALYSTFFIGTDIKKAAILGCGPIGLLVLLSLRQQFFNADIYVTDKINDRLSVAGDQGALWAGNPLEFDIVRQIEEMVPQGLDVVFECCGQQDAINQAIKLLKPGGSLIIVGIPETKEIAFDIHKIRRKEIAIFNVRRQNETYPKTIESVHSGQIDLSGLVSHVFHYSESQRAFDIANNYEDSVIKALIKFD
jgi:L-iditol 2-dehydrogenase